MTRRICVFCGSSPGVRESYRSAARALACEIAARQLGVVYGGGRSGLMGALADAALEAGAEVIGVIPRAMVEREVAHTGVTDLRMVRSMHERKALMYELADCFIALPGGFGTFEEFCEVLTWTQLGLQRKPCGILNVDDYYDHLLTFFDHASGEGFVKPQHRLMVLSANTAPALLDRLIGYEAPRTDKWIEVLDET